MLLDEEHAARLRRMADQSDAAEGTLARSLLSLPADTRQRLRRSIEHLRTFPRLGRELEGGGYGGLRFLLGPWRRMIVVHEYDEAKDIVGAVTVQDARSSTAATSAGV